MSFPSSQKGDGNTMWHHQRLLKALLVTIFLLLLLLIFPLVPRNGGYTTPISSLLQSTSNFNDKPVEKTSTTKLPLLLVGTQASSVVPGTPQTTTIHAQPEQTTVPTCLGYKDTDWVFSTTRDAQNYGLTEDQCSSAFRPLFAEIDRAVEYRKAVGNITVEDVDIDWVDEGAMRVMIYHRQVLNLLMSIRSRDSYG
jgi:hypothetical protein